MRFFKGLAAALSGSTKTGDPGDLVIVEDTARVAVADGSSTLGELDFLARDSDVAAARAAATADAATDATTKANAARTAALDDVAADIAGGTGPVSEALAASFEGKTTQTGALSAAGTTGAWSLA